MWVVVVRLWGDDIVGIITCPVGTASTSRRVIILCSLCAFQSSLIQCYAAFHPFGAKSRDNKQKEGYSHYSYHHEDMMGAGEVFISSVCGSVQPPG